jgi:hypothetical protein
VLLCQPLRAISKIAWRSQHSQHQYSISISIKTTTKQLTIFLSGEIPLQPAKQDEIKIVDPKFLEGKMGGDKPPEEPCLSVNGSRRLTIKFDLSILSFVESIAPPDVGQGITGSYMDSGTTCHFHLPS